MTGNFNPRNYWLSIRLFQIGQLALVFFVGIQLSACAEIEEDETPPEQRERPVMLFEDTTVLDMYDGSVLSWIVRTAYLERWGGSERIFARPILADIYDSLGEKTAFLRADSGSMDSRLSFINAYGNVFAQTPKGASIRADSLIWNKKDNLVQTESPVRVVTPGGDVLSGVGFISDAKLENWQILSGVTAIFQNAEDRIREEDDGSGDAVSAQPGRPERPLPRVSQSKSKKESVQKQQNRPSNRASNRPPNRNFPKKPKRIFGVERPEPAQKPADLSPKNPETSGDAP